MEIRVSKDMKESETTYYLAKKLWCSASYGLRIWKIVQCSTFQQIEVIIIKNAGKQVLRRVTEQYKLAG